MIDVAQEIRQTETEKPSGFIPEKPSHYNDYQQIKEFSVDKQLFKLYHSKISIDRQWDEFISKVKNSCFQQFSGWVNLKKKEGWDFFRIIYKNEDSIVAGYQVLVKNIPLIGKAGYLNHGPVTEYSDSEFLERISSDLKEIADKFNLKLIFIGPPESPSQLAEILKKKYYKNSFPGYITVDAEVDITADENTLIKNLLRMRRQNISKSKNYSFRIEEGTRDDLEIFFSLMKQTCERNHVKPNPPDVESLRILWDYYHPMNMFNLYKFYIDDELISAIITIEHQDYFITWKYGWSGKKSSLKPNDVFHWELLKLAKSKGFKKYNLGAINEKTAEIFYSKEKPLTEGQLKSSTFFKLGFGGYAKKFPDPVICIPKLHIRIAYQIFSLLSKKTRLIKKLMLNN
jgi:lipid II:glycine glycyltransferase (peptidoglycan interpeptide bridge formation enzyme)